MIYAPGSFLFVHIPRCAGNSLAIALAPLAAVREVMVNTLAKHRPYGGRHSRAVELALVLPDFEHLWRWTVMRPPWEIVASEYRLTWRDTDAVLNDPAPGKSPGWVARLQRFHDGGRDFGRFVREEFTYLERPGGFYDHWCCGYDGTPLCEPIQFAELGTRWTDIRARLTEPGVAFPEGMPRVNAGADVPIPWTPELIEYVGQLCHRDLSRFGYAPPLCTRPQCCVTLPGCVSLAS